MAASSPKSASKSQSLSDKLDAMELQDPKTILQNALNTYLQEELKGPSQDKATTSTHTMSLLPGGGMEPSAPVFGDVGDAASGGLQDLLENGIKNWVQTSAALAEKPLEKLPCANVDPGKDWKCPENGRSACGECKLVSYCSKECQRAHWRTHKRGEYFRWIYNQVLGTDILSFLSEDCKDPIRSPLWQPAWIREMREPTFAQSSPGWNIPLKERQFALGMHLWGNIPAVDTLNLSKNEGVSATKSNIALAYVASGDLRNVLRTVNELPDDYAGELTILLNDREPMIVLRNILLLMILGTIEDIALATDVALHFWGSAFMQAYHDVICSQVIMQLGEVLQQDDPFSFELGANSVITGSISKRTFGWFSNMLRYELRLEDAHTEIHRIRFEPTRQDRHHRQYVRLSPSHRLASLEYRRFGLVLPFGAANNNFNTPNRFLFSPDGRWLQDDLASPLDSWNIEDVIKSGKAHGAQSADLYGCLYFYLSDQLRSFAKRIRKFRISFRMFDQDARELATKLRSGAYKSQGLLKKMTFDRIEVSNIIDEGTNRCATLLGYSMNWVPKQYNSQPHTSSQISKLTKQLMAMGKIDSSVADAAHFPALMKYLTVVYDNSAAFEEYLKKQSTEEAARKVGAKLKAKHSIVPHRIGAPLDGPSSALPQFTTEESWYLNVQVGSALLSERFVEFSRV